MNKLATNNTTSNGVKIFVTIKSGAKTNSINQVDPTHFKISTKSPAIENKANIAVIKILSEFFDVPQSYITLLAGTKSRQKILEVVI